MSSPLCQASPSLFGTTNKMSSQRQVSIGLLLAHIFAAGGFLIGPAAGILAFAILHGFLLVGTLVPRLALFGKVITHVKNPTDEASCIHLTIDDGPDPADTPALLDLLDRYQATATFFLIGEKARQHPHLVREILHRGHSIGNHTFSHPASSFWFHGPKRMAAEIDRAHALLTEIAGHAPHFFRPPAGHHNPYLFALLEERNLPLVAWNRRGFDTRGGDPADIAKRISHKAGPGDIVLIHEATPIAAALAEQLLENLTSSGLQIRALPHASLR